MTFENIIKDIKSERYNPVYFLHGEEAFYIDQIADLIESTVLNEGEKAFNQVVLYGKDTEFKTIVDEARQFPMMSRYRVIILKEAQEMKTLADLATYMEKPSGQSILVICYKHKKLDKRTKFAKQLDQLAVVFESKKLYDNQVAAWVTNQTKILGHTIDAKAAGMMAEYIGADLSKLNNEIEKLILSAPKGLPISVLDVQDQIGISKDFNVFELQTALGEKNFVKANLIIHYFIENPKANPTIGVISNLYLYFNKVYIAAYHKKESENSLAKLMGVSPFFVKDYISASKKYSLNHLLRIFQALKIADQHSKGVGARHADESTIYKDILITCISDSN